MRRVTAIIASMTVVLALSLLAGVRAGAAEPAKPSLLQGVWQGTIGKHSIRACFSQGGSDSFGAYYYLAHKQTIALERSDRPGATFVEGSGGDAKSPRWQLDRVSAAEIAGRWSQGSRTLPLHLTRINGLKSDETACSSLLFHNPRLEGVRVISKPALKDGVRYTRLILDHLGHFNSVSVETFAIEGNAPAVARINAKLREPLASGPESWFECVRVSLKHLPYEGDSYEKIEPRMVSHRWLSVESQSDWNCGGAHPESGSRSRTFNLQTGREVDLHDWLNAKAVARQRYDDGHESKKLVPAFRTFIIAGWKHGDPDCTDTVRSAEYWHIELTRTGLVFTPDLPRVAQACGEEFRVPFARLEPYVSADGRSHADSLRNEAATAR